MKKVRIKKAGLGTEVRNQVPYVDNTAAPNFDVGDIGSDKPVDVNSTLSAVPRKEANLEAEKGETAVTDLNNDGLPEFYKIGGKPHSKGGTPLNLPENSFIYSKDKSLACKDPELLSQFGKTPTKKKKKYTPAELSMQYDINNYRKILADPNSDALQISTAESMIKNYMDKLGALALVQESKKGFDNGIPKIAQPYLEKIGITSEDLMPPPPPQPEQGMAPQGMPPQGMAPAGPPAEGMPPAGPPPMAAAPQGMPPMADPGMPAPNEAPPEVVPVPAKYGLEVYDKGGSIPEADKKYIDRIIQYELNHGAGDGTGLSYKDWSKGNATDQASAEKFIYDTYVKPLNDLNLPVDVRKRAVDMYVNSEDPRASLMVAAGIITPKEKGALYPGGKLDVKAVDALYKKNKGRLKRAVKQDGFTQTFDAEKHRSYKATNGADVSYDATWGPRVDMWNESYTYDNWKPGTNYQELNNVNTAIDDQEIELKETETVVTDEGGNNVIVDQTTGDVVTETGEQASSQNPQKSVVTKSSTKSTGRQNIPKDAILWDVDAEGYNPQEVEVGDYVKHDGRWYKQTKKVYKAYDGPNVDEMDPKLNGSYGDMREPYGRLVQKFNNDPDVRKSFLTNFRSEIDGLKAGTGNVKQADIDKLKGLSDQEAVDYFLNGNKHHMEIAAQMGDVKDQKNVGKWDKGSKDASGIPSNYKAAIGKVGLNPMSTDQTLGFQSGYIALQKMYDNPDMAKKLKNFQLPKTGVSDDSGAGHANISKADGWEGNTTAGEMVLWKPSDYKLEEEEAEWLKQEQTIKEDAVRKIQKPDTPYWTQDKINVGNALIDQFGIKKRSPWTATPNLTLPDPTFADFRGAAARLGSQAQAGAQQLSTFGTPQAFNAGFANIQRNNVKGITALQDQEYKTNVATANQFATNRAQMLNTHSNNIAALKTKQYDKQTIADQQYDNAKKAARWNTVGMINNALTNRGMTQNMNANTDSFYIDPRTGYKHFYEGDPFGTDIGPTKAPASKSDAAVTRAEDIKSTHPGMTWGEATKLATVGTNTKTTTTDPNDALIGTSYPGGGRRRGVRPGYQGGFNPYTNYRQNGQFDPRTGRRMVKYGGGIGGKRKCKVKLPK
jgi:hypothetical protein